MKILHDNKIIIISLIFIISFFQLSYRIGEETIKIWDESSAARSAIEMLHSGNYLYATYNGEPNYYDVKPPLQLWLKVIAFKIFGVNEFAVRFPTLLANVFLLLFLFWFSDAILKSKKIGILMIILPSVSIGYVNYHMSFHGDTDILLIFLTTLYLLLSFVYIERYPQNKNILITFISFTILAAFMTKSIAGLSPLIGVFFYVLLINRKILVDKKIYFALLFVFAMIAIYFAIVSIYAPDYVAMIFKHHLMPFAKYPSEPKHPEFSYYFSYLANNGFYPYLYLIPISIIVFFLSKNLLYKRLILFLLITSSSFLIGQSVAVMKNAWYIGPIYPLLWMLISVSIIEAINIISSRVRNIYKPISITAILVIFIGTLSFSYIKVYDNNEARYNGVVYQNERDGEFLNSVLAMDMNIKKIVVLNKYVFGQDRQIDYYIKKYNFFYDKKVTLVDSISKNLEYNFVMSTNDTLLRKLKSEYLYDIVFKRKYGELLYVYSARQKSNMFFAAEPEVYLNYYKNKMKKSHAFYWQLKNKYNTPDVDALALKCYSEINKGKSKEEILDIYRNHIRANYYDECKNKSNKKGVSIDDIINGDAQWYYNRSIKDSSTVRKYFSNELAFNFFMEQSINYKIQ